MAKEHAMIESGRRQSLGKRIWKNRWVYLFLLPGIAFVLPVFFQQGALVRGIGKGMDSQMVAVGMFGAPDGA